MSTPAIPSFTTFDCAIDGPIGRVTFNRPAKLNPLSVTCLDELAAAARFFDDTPSVRAVIFAGEGRAFSAGADLSSFTAPSDRGPRGNAVAGLRMTESIERMRAATIAAIHGHCIGGAVVLSVACDFRIAARNARFSIPEVDLGIPLTWGAVPRLVRELGPAMARDLVLTCRPFSADEAFAMGFVTRLVDDDDLVGAAHALAAEIAAKSRLTVHQTLEAIDAAAEAMVPTGYCWADADAITTALRDPESQAVAEAYIARITAR